MCVCVCSRLSPKTFLLQERLVLRKRQLGVWFIDPSSLLLLSINSGLLIVGLIPVAPSLIRVSGSNTLLDL